MATVLKVIAKEGTTYGVDSNGANNIKQLYQVLLSAPLASGELLTSFSAGGVSVPSIGSVHPARAGYYVDHYDITQPKGKDKSTLDIAVVYTAKTFSTESITEDETTGDVTSQVEEWGWDDSTSDREMISACDGTPVVNSAGDIFESVPSIQTPSPVFTKVVKMPGRRVYASYNCKINTSQLIIGGMTCAPKTLLCTIAEKRNIGDTDFPYTYTIRLRYRSNIVKAGGDTSAGEIGWNVAIADAGMRELDDDTGQLKHIQVTSKETGEMVNVSSPELLDGQGHAVARSASGSAAEPYNIVFQAYELADFPAWLYSEP